MRQLYDKMNRKISRFKMWKSGKQWLFGASVITAMSLGITTQAVSANVQNSSTDIVSVTVVSSEGESVVALPISEEKVVPLVSTAEVTTGEVVSETSHSDVAATETELTSEMPQTVEVTENSNGEESLSSLTEGEEAVKTMEESPQEPAQVLFEEKKPVHLHFETDEEATYGVWVWGNGVDSQDSDKTTKTVLMTKRDNGVYEATLQAAKDKTTINYIIVKADADGKPQWDNGKQTGNMIATVNEFADTHIYIGKNKTTSSGQKSWYSQVSAQTEAFDNTFAYRDKVVDPNQPDKFKTVGKLGRLGATLNADGKTALLNLWAPTAKSVTVNLYDTSKGYQAPAIARVDMVRGTKADQNDYSQNTIGVWTLKLDQDFLAKHNLETANMLSYDYELTIPNAFFIQAEEKKKQEGDKWVHDYYIYRNSKTGKMLNGSDQAILGNRAANWEEIAAFYASDTVVRDNDKDNNIVPQEQHYQTVRTQDPYSVGVVQNGSRSVILDPSVYGKVTQSRNVRVNSLSELSVMEIDVRDFSIDEQSGVSQANRGNYLGVIEETAKTEGKLTGLNYLTYTGVKYVQIMPVNDFQTVPELDKDHADNTTLADQEKDGQHENQQNWGYDPKNYNVPEGSYASDPAKPENRIIEMKQMVQGLHDAGINVVLDVVYNHLYHGQENPFEWIVPGYYYAVNGDNAMNNDVGVGNAVRSNSRMMRQYIVNSVVYWANEYGVDGFRFDAMSDLDTKTLTEVRQALDQLDKRIVTYGEGWDSMGNYLSKEGEEVKASIGNAKKLPHYGFFDSTGRDAIAGSQYGDHPNAAGFVNRDTAFKTNENNDNLLSKVADSLLGGLGRSYASPSQQLNYIEVHDGTTLRDLLKKYNPADTEPELHHRIQLATAMSALSQGIHFSQMGQEFGRTKADKHNTYNAGDVYNKIDWSLISKNPDLVNFYKSLVAFRTSEPLMHLTTYDDVKTKMVITNAQNGSGVITYELRGEDGTYLVVFNNNTMDNGKLTLGGNSWYYGGKEKINEYNNGLDNSNPNRGQINATNDFTDAFVVLSNAKGLYGRIGQTVGSQTVTLDPLSATVFYLPKASQVAELKTVTQTVTYKTKDGKAIEGVPSQARRVTFLTVSQEDPRVKFAFEKSQLTVAEGDLGHRDNILTGLRDKAKVTYAYYAVDASGNPIETSVQPTLDNHGKPIDTETIKWKLVETAGGLTEATGMLPKGYTANYEQWLQQIVVTVAPSDIPTISGFKLVASPHNSDWQLGLSGDSQLTVTYAKESSALIISDNDPENTLTHGYEVGGYEGEAIRFPDEVFHLERAGYTYTVNGKASLAEALAEQATFASDKTMFRVVYQAQESHVRIAYLDSEMDYQLVAETTLTGKVGDLISLPLDLPEGYELAEESIAHSWRIEADQELTIMLKHKHHISEMETINKVRYQGAGSLTPVEQAKKVTWIVDTDLVTNRVTYSPQEAETKVKTPRLAGYKATSDEVVLTNHVGTEVPVNQETVITYRPILPVRKQK